MNRCAAQILWGIAVATVAVACRNVSDERPRPPALRSVSLPDLAGASEPVRAQLREEYQAFTRHTQSAATAPADRAAAYGRLGMLLMAAEYREEAEAALFDAQALAPDDFQWPYYLAHLHKARGETDKSVRAFEEALRRRPHDAATLVWLGRAHLDQGRPDAAAPLFARALETDPQSVAALVGAGQAALAQSDYTRAAQDLERALALHPREASVHYPLAMAYRGLGDMDKADAHMRLRTPGDVQPDDPLMRDLESLLESAIAYEVRGAKALDAGDWKAAAAAFRKGIELAPAEPSLHHKLGTALYLDGDAAGAAAAFDRALRLSPHFAKAHYSLGIMRAAAGQAAPAVEHLSAALRDDPAYVEARLRLADVLRHSGHAAESLTHYARAATLDPRLAEARFGEAMALVALDRYHEARERLADDLKQYPGHLPFARALVRLLAAAPDDRARDGAEAMRILQQALTNEPRGADHAEITAMTLAALGRYDDAVAAQREAIAAAERGGRSDRTRGMAQDLSRYERRQPCRTPWRDEASVTAEER
jgi:tetratricopeptide (TPR) repeat protein